MGCEKMTNIKAGVIGVIATVIAVILELILFPIALNFLTTLNDSSWVTSTDRTILNNTSTLMIVIVIMTLIGGVIGSIAVSMRGN